MSEILQEKREQIDKIDSQILELINTRAKVALEIGHLKKQNNLPVISLEREKKLLDKIRKMNQGVISDEQITAIFEQLILVMREIQETLLHE